MKAQISEIFYSHQGEGIYVGQPQIFVRFFGCNIKCKYCDTMMDKYESFDIERTVNEINRFSIKYKVKTVAITGGEPLLQVQYLQELLPVLKKNGFRIYLETNGTLPKNLGKIIKWVDIVSMDIKLYSGCRKRFWNEHEEFLQIAKNKAFIKIVVTAATKDKEISRALLLIKRMSAKIPLVFQPVTPDKKCKSASPENIYKWRNMAKQAGINYYILPQLHKFWGIR